MTARDTTAWRALRDLEPGLGSRRRVLANIEAELGATTVREPSPARTIAFVLVAAAAIATLWLSVPAADRDGRTYAGLAAADGESRTESSASAVVGTDADEAGHRAAARERAGAPGPELRVDRDDSVAIDLADAAITVVGPAAVQVAGDALLVHRGRVSIDGTAVVRGATCDARVSGSADVEVAASHLEVRVFAGSAEVTPGVDGCTVTIMDLAPPAPPAPSPTPPAPSPTPPAASPARESATVPGVPRDVATRAAPAATHTVPEPSVPEPAVAEPAPPSSLRQQVEAFRVARALTGADALAAWRDIVDRWPDSPLREEADAAIIDALVSLGRSAAARAAAQRFVNRYPDSPRGEVYRTLAQGAP